MEEKDCLIKDLIRWEKANPMPHNVESRYVTDFGVAIWMVKNGLSTNQEDMPYLKPVYKSSVVLGKTRIHPTQKNLKVVIDLIKVHTSRNDLIFDPLFGSATTAVACLLTSREFIGVKLMKNIITKRRRDWMVYSPMNYTGNKAKLLKEIFNILPTDTECFYDVLWQCFGGSKFPCERNSYQRHFKKSTHTDKILY